MRPAQVTRSLVVVIWSGRSVRWFVSKQCIATCQAETPTKRSGMTADKLLVPTARAVYTPRAYNTGGDDVGN